MSDDERANFVEQFAAQHQISINEKQNEEREDAQYILDTNEQKFNTSGGIMKNLDTQELRKSQEPDGNDK